MSGPDAVARGVPVVEVAIRGDLDVWTVPGVSATLEEAIALAPQQLIIDLAGCPSIDAAGIVLLLDTHRRAIRNGGTVALRSASARLQRNLRLAKVDRVFQVISSCPPAPDEQERHST